MIVGMSTLLTMTMEKAKGKAKNRLITQSAFTLDTLYIVRKAVTEEIQH
jgi:hypothetical protein